MIQKAARKVTEAEAEIAKIEAEIAAVESSLADTSVPPDATLYDRHAALQKDLENAMSLWELASMEHDDLKQKYGLL
ncbi:MAG: hypothetical protein K2G94_06420, partial [Muribaculaceae bacterium]|nr:hypothetical protein [Muribaculaceae bacterium]